MTIKNSKMSNVPGKKWKFCDKSQNYEFQCQNYEIISQLFLDKVKKNWQSLYSDDNKNDKKRPVTQIKSWNSVINVNIFSHKVTVTG